MTDCTVLEPAETDGLGRLSFLHPAGTFALTPASRIGLRAIFDTQPLLSGSGIDWGSGTGCLAIAAARIPAVERVYGLELSAEDVDIAGRNALLNGVVEKAFFVHSDSYTPFDESARETIASLKGKLHFILANPPASEGNDGFGFRRIVLRGARDFLFPGGRVFLNISCQYGRERIARLCQDAPGFTHRRIVASTGWVPFDLSRPDLLECLELYAREEERGGMEYAFAHPDAPDADPIDARSALDHFERTGQSPLSKWQTHLFEYA